MTRSTSGKACDACRHRKLKCSRTLNNQSQLEQSDVRCVRCVQTDLRCTFDNEHRKRGPVMGKRLRALRVGQQASQGNVSFEGRQAGELTNDASNLTMLPHSSDENSSSVLSTHRPDSEHIHREQATQNDAPLTSCQVDPACSFASNTALPVDTFEISDLTQPIFAHEAQFVPDQTIPNRQELQLWSQVDHGFPIPTEKILLEISLFMNQAYTVYPLFHYQRLMRKINANYHISDPDFGCFVLSIAMLNEAYTLRRTPRHEPFMMHFLAKTIESRRIDLNGYHFSENPSIDAVIVSLFLFIIYNVSEKHNRAFYYLTEAIGLLDLLGEPSDMVEVKRLRRLEYVLYIAESATISIYGSQRKRMISRRPEDPPESIESLQWYGEESDVENCVEGCVRSDIAVIDKQAIDLLVLMTRLHLATKVADVAKFTVDDRLMCSILRDQNNDTEIPNPRHAIQTADVAITRQWKLAALWWEDVSHLSTQISPNLAVNSTIEMIATTTLTWSRTLKPGCLRIVGLGKVVALTESILNISSRLGIIGSSTTLIRHLIRTVAETDYDQYFAPQLSITEICIGDIPRSLILNDEPEHFFHSNEWGVN